MFITRAVLIVALAVGPLGRAIASEEARFGRVEFPISCSAEAQRQFNHAVAMLHSFFFPETQKAFSSIVATEPSCAMTHWGLAISQRPNPLVGPFPDDVLQRGLEAIGKARAAAQKTKRESDWIEALAQFYENFRALPQQTRTLKYEAAMAALHARAPDDVEAAIFYALALNEAADPLDKSYARQLKAAALLETLEAKYPEHPGIPHYIIHSYDSPEIAHRGVSAAMRCAQLAPAAPHALHMPSHIFSTLGMWHDVIKADRASDDLTVSYTARIKTNPARYHSLDFLINAHLQLAQDKQAELILDLRNRMSAFPTNFRYSGHTAYAAIPVRYAFERGAWAEAAALAIPSTPFAQAEAISWFGRAIGAARSGDTAAAMTALDRLRALKATLVANNDTYWAGQAQIQEIAAAAWIALRDGRAYEAVRAMRQAADLEDRSGKHVAMENRLSPMRELLGELLLEANQAAAALKEFELSLRNYPNRYRSLAGAAKAAQQLGLGAEARKHYQALAVIGGSADSDRPDLEAARLFLAR